MVSQVYGDALKVRESMWVTQVAWEPTADTGSNLVASNIPENAKALDSLNQHNDTVSVYEHAGGARIHHSHSTYNALLVTINTA